MLDISPELKVKKQSLAYEVANLLSKLILDGSLPPGTRLLEVELASKLGVSRGPLREALRILEAEALIETLPGRGSYVAPLSKNDAEEVYSLRIILEQEAVRLACIKATEQQINILREVLTDMIDAAHANEYSHVADLDILFHQKIWEMAGNKRLKQVLESMHTQMKRYLSLQTHLYDSLVVGISDHKTIFDAIESKDQEVAIAAICQHLNQAVEAAITNLPKGI